MSLQELNRELSKIGKNLLDSAIAVPDAVVRAMALGANDIRNTVILSMRGTPKTGRHYRRGKSGKSHIASSSGNAPAIDYGELVRSIAFDVRPTQMEVEVGSVGGAPYSIFLEEGTKKMEARPFLGPAVDKHRDDIIKNIGDIAFEVIRKGFQ